MPTNDEILFDSIIEKKIQELHLTPTNQVKGSVFEKIALRELLKSYDLSDDVVDEGITDGENDGGIDALYVFVNGNICNDGSETFKTDSISLTTYLVTSKHDDTFIMHPLESMYSSINNLFDFSKKRAELIKSYNEHLVDKALLYRNVLMNNLLNVKNNIFKVCYVSRGETKKIASPVDAKMKEICDIISQRFADAKVDPIFWGAKELLLSTRIERNGSVNLQCERSFQYKKDYVVLVKLTEYYKFVTDEEGAIKRYFFDENVRDYLGDSGTNKDIMETLSNENDSIDFWNLNNGITILAKEFRLLDRTGVLTGVQIVNGLQTTMSIYNCFNSNPEKNDDRMVLIKIIAEKNEEDRKRIIRATNNQSQIALYSLHANDKIQKDIEDVLLSESLYYERKKMLYQNKGVNKRFILTPLILARAFASTVLKSPCSAARFKQDFMEDTAKYNLVFNSSISIKIWPVLAKLILKIVECQNSNSTSKDILPMNANKVSLCYLCFMCVAASLNSLSYTTQDLISFNINRIDSNMVAKITKLIGEYLTNNDLKKKRLANIYHGNQLLELFKKEFNIVDAFVFSKNKILDDDYNIAKEVIKGIRKRFHSYQKDEADIEESLKLIEEEFNIDKKKVRAILFGS